MDKFVLPDTDTTGAVCLDGTPGIYYFKAGSEANKTKWVLHFLGGGMCMSGAECQIRSKTYLGSSSAWGLEFDYQGPLSEDPKYNPDFYDWNHAFFVYCDGVSFSGDVEDPVQVGEDKLYYRGHRILLETIKDLKAKRGLDQATEVLVVGDSAGGMATFYHIDEISSLMPDSVTRFKGAPFSGVFLDRPNVDGVVFFRDVLGGAFKNQNCAGGVNSKCIAAQTSPDDYWKCFFAEYSMTYTDTPLFVLNSAGDTIGLLCIALGEPLNGISNGTGNCSAVPGWEKCELEFTCTDEQWSKMLEYSTGFRDVIENHPKMNQDGNGLFEYDCYTHAVESGFAWDQVSVQGTVMRDAVRKWFFSDNEPASEHTYKDCINTGVPACNPTCVRPVPPTSSSSTGSNPSSGSSPSSQPSSGSNPSSQPSSGSKPTHSSTSTSSLLHPMMSVICVALIALYLL